MAEEPVDLDADLPDDPREREDALYKRMGLLIVAERGVAVSVDASRRRSRFVSIVGVVALLTALFAYRTAQREACIARNAADVEILRIVNTITQPLPVNPTAPAATQEQIRERNASSAAFRVSMNTELRPRGCPWL